MTYVPDKGIYINREGVLIMFVKCGEAGAGGSYLIPEDKQKKPLLGG